MDGLYEQFRIAVHQVWQRRWLALAVAWGVCVLGWLVVAIIPSTYEAKARVFVQLQSMLPTQMGITPDERQNQLMRLKQTLTSNENLARVVRRTELNRLVHNERDLAGQVSALRPRIEIVTQPDGLIELKAKSNVSGFSNAENARTAAAVAQALVDLFLEGNLTGNRQETGQSLEFLDQELRRREAQLQEAEQRRVEFEQRFLGLLPGQGSISDRMSAARAEIANLEAQIVAAQSSLNAMRSQLASTPQSLPMQGGGGYGPASSQLGQLEAQLSQYLGRGWTEQHPDVITLRQQIARLRPSAQEEVRGGGGGIPNPSYVSLRAMMSEREAQLASAQARRAQLQSDLQQISSHQSTAPGLAAEQERLERDYNAMKLQYDRLLENREQIRLRGEVQTQAGSMNVQVVEPPSVPKVPSAPNRPIFLSLVLFAAIAAGIGTAFVLGQLQTTFPTQGRLAQVTGLPVLGTVTEVVTAPERLLRRKKLAWLGGTAGALGGAYVLLMLVEFWQRSTVA